MLASLVRSFRPLGYIRSALTLTLELKLFKRLLQDRKGDAKLQGFGVTDPPDLQIPERLG